MTTPTKGKNKKSVTSFLFLSYLFFKYRIKFESILPQGKSKRGFIDYMYFPESTGDVNVFIEIKPYGSIGNIDDKLSQLKRYMTNKLPKIALQLDRKDGWVIGIVTDLKKLKILFRKNEWGDKSRFYTAKEAIGYQNVDELFRDPDLRIIFDKKFDYKKFLGEKISSIEKNKHRLLSSVLSEARGLKYEIYNEWKNTLQKQALLKGKSRQTFNTTLALCLELWAKKNKKLISKDPFPQYIKALKAIINEKRDEIKLKAKETGLNIKLKKKFLS